jgi:hypothetical protein
MEGFIKLYRKFILWEWYDTPNMVHLFITLLLKANHEPGNWHGININRGQLITGIHSLSKSTGITVRSIRTCINRLKSTGEVTIKTTNKYSIITICNYDIYQSSNTYSDKQNDKQTGKRTTSKRQANDNKQECKECKEEYIYSNFYDFEISKCNGDINYPAFVGWLFGTNLNKRPFTKVLNMTDQISFEQFNKYISKYGHEKLKDTIINLDNYTKKTYSSFNSTLNNWLKRD